MFNKKRIIIFFIFILLMFFMMTFAGGPIGPTGVNTRHVIFTDGFNMKDIVEYDVEVGKGVKVPKDPHHKNYVFSGWFLYEDHDVRVREFDKILNDLHVIALYGDDINNNGIDDLEDTYYTVSFINSLNNDVIKREKVLVGMNAHAPNAPIIKGYTFAGWDRSYRNVESNLNVYTIYNKDSDDNTKKKQYTVTFIDGDTNEVISKAKVNEGASATLPKPNVHKDRVFVEWVGNYTNVKKNETVVAKYADDKNHNGTDDETEPHYDIVFKSTGNGKITGTLEYKDVLVDLTFSEAGIKEPGKEPKNKYYKFDNWYTDSELKEKFTYSDNTQVKGNMTITGVFVPINDDYSENGGPDGIADEEQTFEITINYLYKEDNSIAKEQFHEERDYYHRDYNVDSPSINHFVADRKNVSGTIGEDDHKLKKTETVYYEREIYTVVFKDWDGTVLKTEKVAYESDATAPENPTREKTAEYTYTFDKWDTDFTKVSEDLVVNAAYTQTANIYKLTITYHYADEFVMPDEVKEYNIAYGKDYSYETPSVDGYSVNLEVVSGTMPAKDVLVEVIYTPNKDTKYRVEYYLQDLPNEDGSTNGYTIVDEDTIDDITGQTNTKAVAPQKTYEGFKYVTTKYFIDIVEVEEDTINGNGRTVVKVYYDREKYTLKTNKGNNIDSTSGDNTYLFGQSVTIDATLEEVEGYTITFASWTKGNDEFSTTKNYTFEMPAENLELTANADKKANTDTPYVIEFYQKDLKENETTETGYTEVENDKINAKGETDTEVQLPENYKNKYEGFTFEKTEFYNDGQLVSDNKINGNGKTVVKIYYTRNTYEVIVDPNCTGDNCEPDTPTPHEFGDTITLMPKTRSYTLTYQEDCKEEDALGTRTVSATFRGYCENDPNCTNIINVPDEGLEVSVKDNVTYYAMWDKKDLKIELEKGSDYETSTYDYTFLNWQDGNETREVGYELTLTKDTTVIANYNEPTGHKYNLTITYHYADNYKPDNTVTKTVGYNETYNVVTPNVDGYTADPMVVEGTMPERNVDVRVIYTPNPRTAYTVEKYYQANGEYTTPEKETRYAQTHTTVALTQEDKTAREGYALDETQEYKYEDVLEATGTVLKVYFKQLFTVTYAPGEKGTFKEVTTSNLDYGTTTPEAPTVTVEDGYHFVGWDKQVAATVTENVTYTAQYEPNENTSYTIEYYLENIDTTTEEYTMKDSDNLSGTTDEEITLPENYQNKYEGFNFKEVKYYNDGQLVNTNTINGNGKTVVKVYYTRNIYSVTLNTGDYVTSTEGSGRYKYGQEVTIDATLENVDGYDTVFANWMNGNEKVSGDKQYTFTMPAENVVYTANATIDAHTATPYRVEYYFRDLPQIDGETPGFTINDEYTQNLTGTTDSKIVVDTTRTFEGFEYSETKFFNGIVEVETDTINGSGNTIVKLYYDRLSYNLTLEKDENVDRTNGEGTYLFGQSVTIRATLKNVPGYNVEFVNWTEGQNVINSNITYTFEMPAKDTTYKANTTTTPKTDTPYRIEYYQQDLEGNNYTLDRTNTENLTGTTNTEITLPTDYNNKYSEGFEYKEVKYFDGNNEVTTNTISGSGNTVVKVYYDRLSYTLTLVAGENIKSTTGSGEYRYGQSINGSAVLEDTPGYNFRFADWTAEDGSVYGTANPATFSMPNNDLTLTARAIKEANTNTPYVVEFYYQENGIYPNEATDKVTDRVSTTDTLVEVTDADKTPTREGYVLDNDANNVFKDETLNGDGTTVLKVYFKQEFTVTYEKGDHGTFDSQEHKVDYNGSVPAFTGDMTHEDAYEFVKWIDQDGNELTENTKVTKDLTYTAQWQLKTYTVKWNKVIGDNTTNIETDSNVVYGSTPEFNGTIPTYTENREDGLYTYNYTFVGWKDQDGNWLSDSTKITKDTTYTAQLVVVKAKVKELMQLGFTRGDTSENVEDRIIVTVVDSAGKVLKTLSKGEYSTNFSNAQKVTGANLVINYNYTGDKTYELENNELYYSVVLKAYPTKFEVDMTVDNTYVKSSSRCYGSEGNLCNIVGQNGATQASKDHNFLQITEHYLQTIKIREVAVKYKNGKTVKLIYDDSSVSWTHKEDEQHWWGTTTATYNPVYLAELYGYDLTDTYVKETAGTVAEGEAFPENAYTTQGNLLTGNCTRSSAGYSSSSKACTYYRFVPNTAKYSSNTTYYVVKEDGTGYKSKTISRNYIDVSGVDREIEEVIITYHRDANIEEGEQEGNFKVIFEYDPSTGKFIPTSEVKVNSTSITSDFDSNNNSKLYSAIGQSTKSKKLMLNKSLMLDEPLEEIILDEEITEDVKETAENENEQTVEPTTQLDYDKEEITKPVDNTEIVNETETTKQTEEVTEEEKKEDVQTELPKELEPVGEVVEVKDNNKTEEKVETKIPEKTENKTEVKEEKVEVTPKVIEDVTSSETSIEGVNE